MGNAIRLAFLSFFVAVAPLATAELLESPSPRQWVEFLSQIKDKGEVTTAPSMNYAAFYLAKGTSFDSETERSVEYITLAGETDENMQFAPTSLSEVQETWRRKEDAWEITQKVLLLSFEGDVMQVFRQKLLKKNSVIVETVNLPTAGPSSEEEINQWRASLKQWMEYARSKPDRMARWYLKETAI